MTTLTATELRSKGITARQVSGAMKRAERLCKWHLKRHTLQGSSAADVAAWDAACARWDHAKATLAQLAA